MFSNFHLHPISILLFVISLLEFAPRAHASVDVYLGLDLGSQLMYETSGGSDYSHKSTLAIGHWGYSIGARPKIDLGTFSLGVVGEIAWIGDSTERTITTASSPSTYRNESHRGLAGASASINTGGSSIVLEYYPWVQNSVLYSDNKAENPYRKNDLLKATGYGVGFNFGFFSGMAYQLLYRNLVYKDVSMNGTKVTLPTDQYKTLKLDEFTIGFVLKF